MDMRAVPLVSYLAPCCVQTWKLLSREDTFKPLYSVTGQQKLQQRTHWLDFRSSYNAIRTGISLMSLVKLVTNEHQALLVQPFLMWQLPRESLHMVPLLMKSARVSGAPRLSSLHFFCVMQIYDCIFGFKGYADCITFPRIVVNWL